MQKIITPNSYKPVVIFFLSTLLICSSVKSKAQTIPVLSFNPLITAGIPNSVEIVNAGDGTNRLFIALQSGAIKIISGGVLQPGNFLNIADSLSIGGERGLLSLVFHPDYANNRYFFVYYTNVSGDITIARFQTSAGNPNVADAATGVVLIKIPKPFANHNGGHLNFGPDGNLYFATGDGGSGGDPNNNSQNGNSLLGKMIRINVDNFSTSPYYSIPSDNPYVTNAAVRDEVFALGLRNPFRWSFDRLNQDVWIADVGQDLWEEVNPVPFATSSAGINYGWRCYEGNVAYNTTGCQQQSNYQSPIFVYPHNNSTGGYSITGGFVYRGTQYPALYGYYICADYLSANAWLIKPDGLGGYSSSIQTGLPGSIVAFGEAENGELYALGLNGILYSVTTSTVLPVGIQSFSGNAFAFFNQLNWSVSSPSGEAAKFEIEFSTDAVNFLTAGTVQGRTTGGVNTYNFSHPVTTSNPLFYRLKIVEANGSFTYSMVVRLAKQDRGVIKIYPTIITDRKLNIVSSKPIKMLVLYATDGTKVFSQEINRTAGAGSFTLPELQKGTYWLQLHTGTEKLNEKIIIQ